MARERGRGKGDGTSGGRRTDGFDGKPGAGPCQGTGVGFLRRRPFGPTILSFFYCEWAHYFPGQAGPAAADWRGLAVAIFPREVHVIASFFFIHNNYRSMNWVS